MIRTSIILIGLAMLGSKGFSQSKVVDSRLDAYDVSWDTPGPTSAQSMPTGNGDIGLNVWTEPNGDLLFFISKTDAWGVASPDEKNGWIKDGGVLMKLGKVRVSVTPNSMAANTPFKQVLRLHNSEIIIKQGDVQHRVWVDANNPIVRVETKSAKPVDVKVTLHNWRIGKGDVVVNNQSSRITWYHQNTPGIHKALDSVTFGAMIKGVNMISKDDTTLALRKAQTSNLVSIYPLTTNGQTSAQWLAQMSKQAQLNDAINLEISRKKHQQWWDKFWDRSWIFIDGDEAIRQANQGYILQRYVTACAGRGGYPIKFNGSIFVVDNTKYKPSKNNPDGTKIDADFREWGGQYWFQNTRPMYWPRLAAGDYDMMLPLFNMYSRIMKDNAAQVKKYYNHGGAYFAETTPFWGGLKYWGPEVKEDWTGHYFTPILELSMMMLDYYEHTGDKRFAKETMMPMINAGIEFFDKHFGRDAKGKLLLDNDNAIEQYWKVTNPAPDIAGLRAVTARLVELPDELVDIQQRADLKRFIAELPELPTGDKNGQKVLLPYTGEQTAKGRNSENPELYALYPFRLFGLGRPELEMNINTFNARIFKEKGCWNQHPIQAAMLGLTDVAKDYTTFALTRKAPELKFPAFWATGHDYAPDEDNGGNGENGLQQMLMQTDGKKIMLLPAWPKEWDNVEFKLNAPYRTTVQGKIVNGKVTGLVVSPASRRVDVIDMSK